MSWKNLKSNKRLGFVVEHRGEGERAYRYSASPRWQGILCPLDNNEEIMLKNSCRPAVTKVPVERNAFAGKAFGKSRGSVRVQTSFLPLMSLFVSLKRWPLSKDICWKADIRMEGDTGEKYMEQRVNSFTHWSRFCEYLFWPWRKASNVQALTPLWHFALKGRCSDSPNESSGTNKSNESLPKTMSTVPHPLLLSCPFNHYLTEQSKKKKKKRKVQLIFAERTISGSTHVY